MGAQPVPWAADLRAYEATQALGSYKTRFLESPLPSALQPECRTLGSLSMFFAVLGLLFSALMPQDSVPQGEELELRLSSSNRDIDPGTLDILRTEHAS